MFLEAYLWQKNEDSECFTLSTIAEPPALRRGGMADSKPNENVFSVDHVTD